MFASFNFSEEPILPFVSEILKYFSDTLHKIFPVLSITFSSKPSPSKVISKPTFSQAILINSLREVNFPEEKI